MLYTVHPLRALKTQTRLNGFSRVLNEKYMKWESIFSTLMVHGKQILMFTHGE